jgi:hypothetical protein
LRLLDQAGSQQLDVARQGADSHDTVVKRNALELVEPGYIDQYLWRGQAEIERGHQTLPARQRHRVAIMLDENGDGLRKRSRFLVGEIGRLHSSLELHR